jgi:hypothetical protein
MMNPNAPVPGDEVTDKQPTSADAQEYFEYLKALGRDTKSSPIDTKPFRSIEQD